MRNTLEVGLKDVSDDVDVIEGPHDQVCALLRLEGIDGAKGGEELSIGPRGLSDEQLEGVGARVSSADAIER